MRLRHVSESEPFAKAREAFSGEFDHQLAKCSFSIRAGIQVHFVAGGSESPVCHHNRTFQHRPSGVMSDGQFGRVR